MDCHYGAFVDACRMEEIKDHGIPTSCRPFPISSAALHQYKTYIQSKADLIRTGHQNYSTLRDVRLSGRKHYRFGVHATTGGGCMQRTSLSNTAFLNGLTDGLSIPCSILEK